MLNHLEVLNVLLVEDDKEIQDTLKEVFSYFFANVYTANDGIEALSVMKEKIIHVIFTDYEMPNLNGLELIKEIRSINSIIPITVISNHDDKEKLQACIPLNLSGYLFKPLKYADMKKYLEAFAKQLLDDGILSHNFSSTHSLNVVDQTLIQNDTTYKLTKMEFLFLEFLVSRNGKVAMIGDIVEHLYPLNPSGSTIKNIVYRLKKKYNFHYIKNIPNLGYKLINDD